MVATIAEFEKYQDHTDAKDSQLHAFFWRTRGGVRKIKRRIVKGCLSFKIVLMHSCDIGLMTVIGLKIFGIN